MIDAEPYCWPYDGEIDSQRLAVVVAGDQRAWYARSVGAEAVASTIDLVTARARQSGATVVRLRHGAPAVHRCALPPAPGTVDHLPPSAADDGDVVVIAGGVDGFHASELDDVLRARGITHLVLTGYGAEAAVDSTLRSANDRGYECLTLTDGVAPFDADTGAHALSSITMSGGIFGAIAPAAALLAALEPIPLEVP